MYYIEYKTIHLRVLQLVQHKRNETLRKGNLDHHKLPCLHTQSLCIDKRYHHRQHRWSEGHEVLQ